MKIYIFNFYNRIEVGDLKNPRLQYIFNGNTEELKKSFNEMKEKKYESDPNDKNFVVEIMMCFWFAIYKQRLE